MNKQLEQFARDTLKENLKKCTPEQQNVFARMYSHLKLDETIDNIVDGMDAGQLDWAMTQVDTTLKNNEARK